MGYEVVQGHRGQLFLGLLMPILGSQEKDGDMEETVEKPWSIRRQGV
jgi:hypothetical protein